MTDSNIATLMTADEAAELLGIHRTTLYDGARRGEIPCRRVGRRFVFVRETLLDWLRSDSAPAARV